MKVKRLNENTIKMKLKPNFGILTVDTIDKPLQSEWSSICSHNKTGRHNSIRIASALAKLNCLRCMKAKICFMWKSEDWRE